MIAAADRRGALMRAALATRSRWPRAAISIALGTGALLAAGALLITAGWLISRAAQRPEILLLGVAIVGVRFFGISRALLRYLERLSSHDLAFRALTDLRRLFFARLVPLVPGAVPGRADLLSRFVADADRMQDLYLRAIAPPLIALLGGIVAIGVGWLILPAAGIVMAVALLAGAVLAPALTAAAARRSARGQAGARAELGAGMVEVVEGASEIAVAGREADWERSVGSSGDRLAGLLRRDAIAGGIAAGSSAMVATATAVAIAAVGVAATAGGALDGIMIASLVMLALATVEITAPLGQAAAAVEAVGDAAARLEEVTSRRPETEPPAEPVPPPAGGALELDRVSFAYAASSPVLSGATLRVGEGEAVALLGPSGSGKSTLGDLAAGLLAPSSGSVSLGGTEIGLLDPAEVRRLIRLAPQDAYLFATTIAANLRVGLPGASDEELREALGLVGLGPWLRELPDGLDTDVGDGGARVSGGQRQRLAMARAILSDSRFCIFDEPTTHLDPAGAADFLARLARLAHRDGRGILVITHERTGLDQFDRVLELRNGEVRPWNPAS